MTPLLESADTVRQISDREGGEIAVSFFNHDGYFRIPDRPGREAMRVRLAESRDMKQDIRFSYDRDLNIVAILS